MKRLLLFFFALSAFAQTPTQITPIQIIDGRTGAAKACAGCKIYTYAAGTTTPIATYTDSTLGTPNTNPVLTNSSGYAVNGSTITGIWVNWTVCYKFTLKDANNVTLWTQDNICTPAELFKVILASAAGAGDIGFSQSSSYSASTVGKKLQQDPISVKDAPYSATGNGTADDTGAISSAIAAGLTAGACVYFPPGTYAISSLTISSSSKTLCLLGNGAATIERITASIQAASHLISATAQTGPVYINGLTFDMRGTGSGTNNTYDALLIGGSAAGVGPSSVTFTKNSVLNAQNDGFACQNCSNVTHSGNYYSTNYWFGAAFGCDGGASGSGPSAVYNKGFTSNGNTYNNTPIGIGYTGYCQNIAVAGETFIKSNIGFLQDPDGEATFGSSTLNGYASGGLANCGEPGGCSGVFIEGFSHLTIAPDVRIYGPQRSGVYGVGSSLQEGSGPKVALPISNVTVSAQVDQATGNNPIQISAASNAGTISTCTNASPVVCTTTFAPQTGDKVTLSGFTSGWAGLNNPSAPYTATNISSTTFSVAVDSTGFGAFSGSSTQWNILGQQDSVQDAVVTNGLTCITLTSALNSDISNNHCDNTQTGGIVSAIQFGTIRGNRLHNVGVAVNNSYTGIDLSSPTLGMDVSNNSIINDAGMNVLNKGIFDEVENASAESDTTAWNNTIIGATTKYVPAGIPAVGTFRAGSLRQAFPTATGALNGYLYNGSQWTSTGYLLNPGTPTVSACGTGGNLNQGDNNAGIIGVGTGGVTSCTLTFSQAFSGTPACTVSLSANSVTLALPSPSASAITITGSADYSSQKISYSCR